MSRSFKRITLPLLLAFLALHSARAETIDLTGFSDGDLVNTIATPSTDVTFAFTDGFNILTDGQPEISSGSNLADSLAFRMDAGANSEFVSLLVTFDDMDVDNVMFTLGDIDRTRGSWQDIVVVTAFLDGVEVGTFSSNLGSSVELDTSNDYTTGKNVVLYGKSNNNESGGQANGNADISFAGVIDSFRVDYRPGTNNDGIPKYGPKNPNSQFIRLGGVQFNAIPEPGSLILFGSVVTASVLIRRRRSLQ